MNTTTEKKSYEAPQLTVVSFKVEQGFAWSNELTGINFVILGEWLLGEDNAGDYAERNGYGNVSGNTWNKKGMTGK